MGENLLNGCFDALRSIDDECIRGGFERFELAIE